ncbi:hypothetical protein [Candidatus Electronema sp. TJ]|uniref:hypothetical protein n=1 Tax=Candidatus Electronema sp. TJ TaxID=3401573 RepID=UPI003AA858E4
MRADYVDLLLLVMPVFVAVLAVWRFHPTRGELRLIWKRQIGLGLAGFVLFFILYAPSAIHYCGKGQPVVHIAAALLSAAIVFFGARPGKRRILSVMAVVVLAELAVNHYHNLVHDGEFIGTTDMASFDNHHEEEKYCSAEVLWHTPITRLYRLHCNNRMKNRQ